MASTDTLKPYALPHCSPATISLTLEPFDKLLAAARAKDKAPKHYALSQVVRVGPLEVSVKAFLIRQPSGEPDIWCEIISMEIPSKRVLDFYNFPASPLFQTTAPSLDSLGLGMCPAAASFAFWTLMDM